MKTICYWTRWVILIPIIVAVYLAFQVFGILVLIPFWHDWVIDDFPGGYEVASHWFWDWILFPFACLSIGAMSAALALKVASAVIPSFKIKTVRIIAALLLLYAVSNLVFIFIHIPRFLIRR